MNVFSEFYDIQESWIRRQLSDFKHDSFINLHLAQKQIEDDGAVALNNANYIDKFRDKYLLENGKKKLSSTLWAYKKG